jgi:hypothetical protein
MVTNPQAPFFFWRWTSKSLFHGVVGGFPAGKTIQLGAWLFFSMTSIQVKK